MADDRNRTPENESAEHRILLLDLQDQHVSVNCEQPSITIGRDAGNRIVVRHPKVSRCHARILMKNGQFVIWDQSTNGTHVHPRDGEDVVLNNNQFTLEGDGTIYLGKALSPDAPLAIHYQVL